ncbi:MAG: TonB-dependent receptor [Opitutaceae bacterium]|nr:TonB-dependent receptor [Opitutaceae bacterium]
MNTSRSRKFVAVLLLAATAAIVAVPAFGQTTAPAGSAGSSAPQRMDKFIVTGSYIPVAADAIAIPVTSITAEDIQRTGVTTNPLDVLRTAIPQFQGNANIGSENANIASGSTGGGSRASLRNLNTLTLINGRRAAVSPIAGTGGYQFVDLNILPLAAIDSIEVLLDGASATYGSDATSGVINIKTKRDYQGMQIGAFFEWAEEAGHWSSRGGNFVAGMSNDKTNVTVAGGYSRQDPLMQFERSFSNPTYGTPTFGGAINIGSNYFVLNPALSEPPVAATVAAKPNPVFPLAVASVPNAAGNRPYFGAVGSNAVYWGKVTGSNVVGFSAGELAGATSPEAAQVAFNLSNYVTILQKREARGGMISVDHKFLDNISIFGDFLTASVRTSSQINAQPVGTTPSFNVTGTHPDNPFNTTVRVRNRFVTNPRVYQYDTDFGRAVLGVRGNINDTTSFETAVNVGRSELAYRNPGVIDSAGLLRAAGISPLATNQAGTSINMFQRNVSPADVAGANFVGTGYNNFRSELNSWDGRVLAKAFQLPAGDVNVALGLEFRRESLKGSADLNSVPDEFGNIKWTGATSVNPFSAKRNVGAGFIEAEIPITGPENNIRGFYKTAVTLAGRMERYSDTEDPTVPKVTLRWQPFDNQLTARATYGESFNAPKLYELFGPVSVGFTPEVNLLPAGRPDVSGNYETGQAQWRYGSNPRLQPAESKSYTLGFIYSPKAIRGLSFDINYWNIEEEKVVGVISPQSILQSVENLGPNSPYVRDLANGQANPAYVGDRANLASYNVLVEGFTTGGGGARITAPGQIVNNIDSIYLTQPQVNIAEQSASGIDFSVRYRWTTNRLGDFNFLSNFAFMEDYEVDAEELAGRATVTGGTIARWRNYSNVSWQKGPLEGFVGMSWINEVDAPDQVSNKKQAEAYYKFDVGLGFRLGNRFPKFMQGLRISGIVKNVGNEKPPILGDTFSDANADVGTYDPIGRSFVISADLKF